LSFVIINYPFPPAVVSLAATPDLEMRKLPMHEKDQFKLFDHCVLQLLLERTSPS